ncbi:MAG TPA: RNA polymerase sigma factor [Myxococcota bacterium]
MTLPPAGMSNELAGNRQFPRELYVPPILVDRAEIELFYRAEFGRILASVAHVIRDLHVAEEAVQEAFAVALERWPREGRPRNPSGWLVATARHKAIDVLRRAGRFEALRAELGHSLELAASRGAEPPELSDAAIPDERLRLIFTCCHPALALESQVALALRTLCGLSTDEIARAFLVPPATLAQRLVRAKRKIADAGIPYQVPPPELLEGRLEAALAVVYLVFNEGYSASRGDALLRPDLSQEAIRLGRLLAEQLPGSPEARGLLALMLLHDARRETRTTPAGDIVLLEDQDRARWNRPQIEEGLALAAAARAAQPAGPDALRAAIAAEHARAPRADATDWRAITRFYDALVRVRGGAVVELNRAIAYAMADGPEAGLALVAALERQGDLDGYYLLWATEADLLRRLGRFPEAARCYRRALERVGTGPERRYLERRLAEVERS